MYRLCVTYIIAVSHFGLFFALLPLYQPKKLKFSKKLKKCLEIASFYIHLPKIMIRWCTVPEIWWATDGRTEKVTYRGVPHLKRQIRILPIQILFQKLVSKIILYSSKTYIRSSRHVYWLTPLMPKIERNHSIQTSLSWLTCQEEWYQWRIPTLRKNTRKNHPKKCF